MSAAGWDLDGEDDWSPDEHVGRRREVFNGGHQPCACDEPDGARGEMCASCGNVVETMTARQAQRAATAARRREMGNGEVKYVADHQAVLERLLELRTEVMLAERDLRQAVRLANVYGVSWTELGDAFGLARQNMHRAYGKELIAAEEVEHVERLIGVRPGQPKLEVHRIVRGVRGVSRLETELVSSHVKLATAIRKAEALAAKGNRVEVHRVDPAGRRLEIVATLAPPAAEG